MRSRPGKVRLKTPPAELHASGLLLDEAAARQPLDLAALFGNSRPVEIELGPGKGAFLLRRAARRPELNFLGIEWVYSYACYAADRAHRAGLANLRLLHADAAAAFPAALPERSTQRVHIYFPDPWPKRRHHRRRLVSLPFLHEVRRVLRIGGWVGIVTDHDGYFMQIRLALAAVPGMAPVRFEPVSPDWLVGSNYERKLTQAGASPHALAAFRWR